MDTLLLGLPEHRWMWKDPGNQDAPLVEDGPVMSHELVLAQQGSCKVCIGLKITALLVIYD